MKKLILLFFLCPFLTLGNDNKVPSEIKNVTVYLSGAQIYRTAQCQLQEGKNVFTFTGLSSKIEENSIQISGLKSVSILSMSYDLNFLEKVQNNPQVQQWEDEISKIQHEIALLRNTIAGLEEEEKVIVANRAVSNRSQTLDLERVKEVSTYYRQRITAIRNEIF